MVGKTTKNYGGKEPLYFLVILHTLISWIVPYNVLFHLFTLSHHLQKLTRTKVTKLRKLDIKEKLVFNRIHGLYSLFKDGEGDKWVKPNV